MLEEFQKEIENIKRIWKKKKKKKGGSERCLKGLNL